MSEAAQQLTLLENSAGSKRSSGIFPAQWFKAATGGGGVIQAEESVTMEQIQPASLDLRLGSIAHKVPASFLPGSSKTVRDRIDLLAEERINIENGKVLRKGKVYIIPLQESLRLKKRMSGFANPKSSTGRLDVFARVITDYGTEFDAIPERYNGPLWLEVAPRSFDVLVRRGSRLAQVRLRLGSPPSNDTYMRRLVEEVRVVRSEEDNPNIKDGAVALSVDLRGDPVSGLIGYKAKRTSEFIDIDRKNYYDPDVFWDPVYTPDNGRGIVLETEDFHILATKEVVAVPDDFAADMVAYDTLVGEMRVHYAGFFDPGFGCDKSGAYGTKIVLEVRSHEVPFMVEHGQIVGRVMFERLTEKTEKPYGAGIGSSYQRQGLTLSKQFRR